MIWRDIIRRYRERHGLTQAQLALAVGVSQRTVSRWERGEDRPNLAMQRRFRDLGWSPPSSFIATLAAAVAHCPAPRAISLMPRLKLLAVSQQAKTKRPLVVEWIGRELAPVATGVLQEMLDDRSLQRAIANGEIAAVTSTSRSVLRIADESKIGTWRTTITYFRTDGEIYSDAQSVRVLDETPLGYRGIPLDIVAGPLR